MKLTVKTFTQNQKSHAVKMEIVAASWTFAQGDQKSDYEQYYQPYSKQSAHGSVGRRDLMDNQ